MKMTPVKSSNLSAVGYDMIKKELHVQFKGGATYIYEGVPAHIQASLIGADSPGAHFKEAVKDGGFKFRKA